LWDYIFTAYFTLGDAYFFKEFLGNRSIKNTEVYITIEPTIFSESNDEEFMVKVVGKPEEGERK
jgi:hypothetical protein